MDPISKEIEDVRREGTEQRVAALAWKFVRSGEDPEQLTTMFTKGREGDYVTSERNAHRRCYQLRVMKTTCEASSPT